MLLEIKVPASFILEWGFPTGAELGFGFRQGWIRSRDVVDVALAKYRAGLLLVPAEEELAILLADDLDRVDELAEVLEVSDQPVELRIRYWALIALGWLFEHRAEYSDPFELIDMLYADLEYPEEVAPLSGHTPIGPGDAPGMEGILQRWCDSVEQWRLEYRNRNQDLMGNGNDPT